MEPFYIINKVPKINRSHWNLPWMSCILKFRSLKVSLETLERSFHHGEKTEIWREASWDIWNSPLWPYPWIMVNLFSFGCHVIDRAYASTDCTGGVGETIKRKGGVSQACLAKSTSFTLDIHNMVNWQLSKQDSPDQYPMTISRVHVSTHWGDVIYLEAVRWQVNYFTRSRSMFSLILSS